MKKIILIFLWFYLLSFTAKAHWINAVEDAIKAAAKSSAAERTAVKAAKVEKTVVESESKINLKNTKPILDDSTKANISFQTTRIISKCKLNIKNQADPTICDKKKQSIESCISEKINLNLAFDMAVKDCETNIIF